MRYRKDTSVGLFSAEERLDRLDTLGDPLRALSRYVDFEFFRPRLEAALYGDYDPRRGGQPPYDVIVMFKMLIVQRLYHLSDDALEYQVTDRLSFQRFLGMNFSSAVPDSKTVWLFRNALSALELERELFEEMNAQLLERGVIALEGQAVDASFVEAPRRRDSREEAAALRAGEQPASWRANPHRGAQKDADANWAKKGDEDHFGYKDHVMSDLGSKLVVEYEVTAASVHDSRMLEALTRGGLARDQEFYADAAYRGAEQEKLLKRRGAYSRVHYRAYRGRPLTERRKRLNTARSRRRARVEHVFGFMSNSMKGMTVRCRSLARNRTVIGLMNLTYNLCRLVQLKKSLRSCPA
jgi:IS5 family transposase